MKTKTTSGIIFPKFKGMFSKVFNEPNYWISKFPKTLPLDNQEKLDNFIDKRL